MNDKPYYWCPKCNAYPDGVTEVYAYWDEIREWKNGFYELVDTQRELEEVLCGNCRSVCEEKEQD